MTRKTCNYSPRKSQLLLAELAFWFISFSPALASWVVLFLGVFRSLAQGSYLLLPFTPILSIVTLLLIVWFIRLTLPRLKPGRYKLGEDFQVTLWYLHMCLGRSVRISGWSGIIKSSYVLKYFCFKALGARISYTVSCSMDLEIADPSLLTIEEGVTIGGRCYIGCHNLKEGILELRPVIIRKNSFIGFDCVLLFGTEIGENCYIGGRNTLFDEKLPNGSSLAPYEKDSFSPEKINLLKEKMVRKKKMGD